MAPYLTGTSFSNEQTVRQIPREITSSERGRGHRVTTRSLACTSCQTRHSDAASYAARFRFRSGLVYTWWSRLMVKEPDPPFEFRTMIISNLDQFKMERESVRLLVKIACLW